MATVQVTTFAAFADAVRVQGDTVEVMNDLDVTAEYPNGYSFSVEIRCAQINGNGHAIKNIRSTDGGTSHSGIKCFLFFGYDTSSSFSTTTISRLHFRHFETPASASGNAIGIWNGNWGSAVFQDCYFDLIANDRPILTNYYYNSICEIGFNRCWFDITVKNMAFFASCSASDFSGIRLEMTNCVLNFKRSDPASTTATIETLFEGFSSFNNSVIMGVLDAEKLSGSSVDFLDYNTRNASISVMNSYMNLEIANMQSLTKTITLKAANGSIFPQQLFAVNTDKIASGVTVTGSNGKPYMNTDAQMKAGQGLDIKENPTDLDWHLDPAYNNGYPFFIFPYPEMQALWAYNSAIVKVTTFAEFADAVAVQGDTVEVMNDLDIAAEYPNGYSSRLNIMCTQINGNGHAIKNVRTIDGSTGSDGNQCLFFFGTTSFISVSSTIINRLHFIHFQTASMGFWNGCWGTVTFQNCHFDMIGGRNVWCNYYYSGASSFAFQQCWFDLTVTDDYEYFAGCGYSNWQSCRLDLANCVVNFKRLEPRSTTASMAFLFGGFSTFNNSVIMGVLDAEKLSQSSTKFLDYNSLNADINIFNSYINLKITNTQSLTKTITLDAMNGYSYPDQLFAVNTDKIAPGITVTGSNDRPFYNTDAQMKAGRGLDIPANPSDTEWRIDPEYNNGYPYFNFAAPELQALWAHGPAVTQVTTFAEFADAVKVQSNIVEVMNDLDIAAEYPDGYPYPLNIKAKIINGNGYAIKNIRETDGDTDALFQFGVDGQFIHTDDTSKYTEINRLHFRNCTPKKIAIMNGNWYQATFNNCYFQFSGDSMVEIAAAYYNYSAVSALCFVGCWFDIEIGANLLWLFTGHTNNNTRLELVNTVFHITDGGTNSGKFEAPFLDIYRMLRCAVLGEFDAKCFKSANMDLLGFKTPSELSVLNSYFNPNITNTDGRTIGLYMSVANGDSYPDQKIAVNSDKFASGITITDDHDQPAINTDVQMKAGRGLDIPASPLDTEWRIDSEYNNGYPYFVFAVPELQALWAYNPAPNSKLFAGSDMVTAVYIGSEQVADVYLGSEKLFGAV